MFRGGLTADLRRLLPIECSGEVMRPQAILPGLPLTVRPYIPSDEEAVSNMCIFVLLKKNDNMENGYTKEYTKVSLLY